MVLPTEARERRLKIELLSYFKAGHSIATLGADAGKFSDFTADELQLAALGLRDSGFIKKVRGRTRDVVYFDHRGRPGHPRRAFGDGLALCNCCRELSPAND